MLGRSIGVFVLLVVVPCEGGERVIPRPGKKPLRCSREEGVSKCAEVEEVKREGFSDPPLSANGKGGKVYRVGDSQIECFPNGQCSDIRQQVTTEPPPKDDGIFYRSGDSIVECFPTGHCDVIHSGQDTEESVSEPPLSANRKGGKVYRVGDSTIECFPNGQCSDVRPQVTTEPPPNGTFYRSGDSIVECFPTGHCDVIHGGQDTGGGPRDDDDDDAPNDPSVDQNEVGSAVCVFKNSSYVQGGIMLTEAHIQSRMQVMGKLRGLQKGMHVLTFHSKGDVETPRCLGVGPYHRPSHRRLFKRQILDLFRERRIRDSYSACTQQVDSCKKGRLTARMCKMESCLPHLKACRACKADQASSYDTVQDMEDTGQFEFRSGVPKKSLTVYADENGDSDFLEEEREQSLHGPDSVIGRSILLSAVPSDPSDNFKGIACCQIQPGCPTIIV